MLSGYAAATALVTGRGQVTSCESAAAQFLTWLAETSHPWLVVLDDLTDEADLDGLGPARPGGPDAGDLRRRCGRAPRHAGHADRAVQPARGARLPDGAVSANRGQRLGAIDLINAVGVEPAALAQASAVIASSAMSCQSYQDYFVRWREYLASSAGAPPLASAVTWPVSLEGATQFAPGGSVRSMLALARCLTGTAFRRPC